MNDDDLHTLKMALQDMSRRARAEKRYLDVGTCESALAYIDDRGAPMPPLALAPAAETPKAKRGRKPKSNGAEVPASMTGLT